MLKIEILKKDFDNKYKTFIIDDEKIKLRFCKIDNQYIIKTTLNDGYIIRVKYDGDTKITSYYISDTSNILLKKSRFVIICIMSISNQKIFDYNFDDENLLFITTDGKFNKVLLYPSADDGCSSIEYHSDSKYELEIGFYRVSACLSFNDCKYCYNKYHNIEDDKLKKPKDCEYKKSKKYTTIKQVIEKNKSLFIYTSDGYPWIYDIISLTKL